MKYNNRRTNPGQRVKRLPRLPTDYPWVLFGLLLEDLKDTLSDDDLRLCHQILRKRDRAMYAGLADRWGLQSLASLGGAYDPEWVGKYQLCRLLAKYRFPSDNASRASAALKKFIVADRACRVYNSGRGKYLSRVDDESNEGRVLKGARHFITMVLGEALPSFDALTWQSRHGPGSSLGTVQGDVSTYHKYANWPYTVTPRAAVHARALISNDPRWLGALENSYRMRNNIPMWSILNWDQFWSSVFDIRTNNRVCFVPKDSQIDRPIAIEPTMNLMLQLGVDGFIRRRLKRFGVDLDSQEKNQRLAMIGSKLHTEYGPCPFSTIDLASASDTVSLRLCKNLLPREWYQYLLDLRSPFGELPDGSVVRYSKISSMGNGYTFALESLIFAALCYGVSKNILGVYPKSQIAVYGDDIVVPWQIAGELLFWLEWSGFTVNVSKSFLFGSVKESCGTDWVEGHLVRPVHLEDTPTSLAELATDRNRLARWVELKVGLPFEQSSITRHLDTYLRDMPRGPLSDTSFSSWVHTRERGHYSGYLYRWFSVVQVPIERQGRDFFFRKLMHSLKDHVVDLARPLSSDWLPDGRVESGNRFIVYRRNALRWNMARSSSSDWQDGYEDLTL
jgi:hypothetical protein